MFHPTKQGLVQSFSVYIDTLLVCSATDLCC
jgi:AGCS family alanine or glycine:cation symporter